MNNSKKYLVSYGLKWDPFAKELPLEGLWLDNKIELFISRMKHLILQGGFAMITGDPGTGKSAALRIISNKLSNLRDVKVGVITRSRSGVNDFYREMGEVFGVKLSVFNRWGGFKMLREKWKNHIETTLVRPVLLIDEAQELPVETLSELRLLQSANFDSVSYLTVILCGDERLSKLLQHPPLIPIENRIRLRLNLQYAERDDLLDLLEHALEKAGNNNLFTQEVMETMVDHSNGNIRSLMNIGNDLLQAAVAVEASIIDEKLYLDAFAAPPKRKKKRQRQ